MKVTIGEVVNELLNYTNLIQVNTVKDLPFLRAYVSGGNGKFTKCFIYKGKSIIKLLFSIN